MSLSSLKGTSSVVWLSRWGFRLRDIRDQQCSIIIKLLFQAFLSSLHDSCVLDVFILEISSNNLFTYSVFGTTL